MEKPQRGARKIIVDGREYWYLIKQSVIIWLPDGKKNVFTCADVKGLRDDLIERGQWKKTTDGMITPVNIESFIRFKMDSICINKLPIDEIRTGMRVKVIFPDSKEIYLKGSIVDKRMNSLAQWHICIGADEEYSQTYFITQHNTADTVFTD